MTAVYFVCGNEENIKLPRLVALSGFYTGSRAKDLSTGPATQYYEIDAVLRLLQG